VATSRKKRFNFKFSWKRSIRPEAIAVKLNVGNTWRTPAATSNRDGRFSLASPWTTGDLPGGDCLTTNTNSSRTNYFQILRQRTRSVIPPPGTSFASREFVFEAVYTPLL
jgi:hypothetical protein